MDGSRGFGLIKSSARVARLQMQDPTYTGVQLRAGWSCAPDRPRVRKWSVT